MSVMCWNFVTLWIPPDAMSLVHVLSDAHVSFFRSPVVNTYV